MEQPFHTVPAAPGTPPPAIPTATVRRWGTLLAAADAADRAVALLCQGVLLLTGITLMGVLTAGGRVRPVRRDQDDLRAG